MPGVDYVFVDEPSSTGWSTAGELLEWAEVFGNRYGTPRAYVDAQLDAGHDVILEIDVQGARQVRDRVPDAVLILLEPPVARGAGARLRGRGTENEETDRDPAREGGLGAGAARIGSTTSS